MSVVGESEKFNGYANRETWALVMRLTNDEGLYESFRELLAEAEEGTQLEYVEECARELLDPDEYREAFAHEQGPELRRMAFEVGSLWRVDWSEVVEALTE